MLQRVLPARVPVACRRCGAATFRLDEEWVGNTFVGYATACAACGRLGAIQLEVTPPRQRYVEFADPVPKTEPTITFTTSLSASDVSGNHAAGRTIVSVRPMQFEGFTPDELGVDEDGTGPRDSAGYPVKDRP